MRLGAERSAAISLGALWFLSASSFLVLASLGLWLDGLRENFQAIVPGRIYRSAQPDAEQLERRQRQLGLRTVVNLRGAWGGEAWYEEECEAAKRLGIEQRDVWLLTHRLAPPHELRKLLEIFDACPKPLLIHCRQGADRTALASAIYLVAVEGKTPAESMTEYRLSNGHTGWAFGRHLPHLFDEYEAWLAKSAKTHSAAEFRQWIASLRSVGIFGVQMSHGPIPEILASGQSAQVAGEIENASQVVWRMSDQGSRDVHLKAVMRRDGRAATPIDASIAAGGDWAPGEKRTWTATIPPVVQPGRYRLDVDLFDATGISFRQFTGEGISEWVSVQ